MRCCFALALLAACEAPYAAPKPLQDPCLLEKTAGSPPKATLADAAWLQGRWVGAALGSIAEETWGPPVSGTMLGMARLDKAGAPWFYELALLAEREGSLELRIKHFHPDLTGWEEKADVQTFPLVRIEPGTLWFDGLTFHRAAADQLEAWVRIRDRDGRTHDEQFRYRRDG